MIRQTVVCGGRSPKETDGPEKEVGRSRGGMMNLSLIRGLRETLMLH